MLTAYTNCRLFNGTTFEEDKAVLTGEGRILGIVGDQAIPPGYEQEDLDGDYLCPAFIDLQIYGGNGKMFSHELSVESLYATYEYCMSGGCANFMITMATNSMEKMLKGLEQVQLYWQEGGRGLLGLHLEGPYINPAKRGAHLKEYIRIPTIDEIRLLIEKGAEAFRMMTLAPEQCDGDLIRELMAAGIIVSAGHSDATYEQAWQGFELGIPAATHLFNAMSALHHRAPGMVGAIFNHPKVMCSLVCDGIHVDYAAVRVGKRQMGERLFYITDAVAETVEGEYQHLFRGDRYALRDGTLSGSALTMLQAVRNGIHGAGISLEESIRMASTYPARVLGVDDRLGAIREGHNASFVVFDEDLLLKRIIVN